MQDLTSIKNVPSLNDYYRKLHFGFAAGRIGLPAERMEECTGHANFNAAELPCEYFSGLTDAEKDKLRKRFAKLCCGNLFAPGLTSLVLSAGKIIRQEFVRTCDCMFRRLIAGGISCCSLDFSLIQTLQDDSQMKIMSALLKQLHPVMLETGMTVLLPVRLPLPEDDLQKKVTGFLRDQMISGLKLRLEIYPHELKPDFSPESLAGTLRLETRSVLFCCNADGGNRLLRAHLIPWLRYFSLNAFDGPFFFCPFSRDNRLAAAESEAFSKLIEEIHKAH